MDTSSHQFEPLVQDYLKRTARFQRVAWIFTAIPLVVFVLLCLLVASKRKEYVQLLQESKDLKSIIDQQKTEIENSKKESANQQFVINLVKQQSPGPRPKVVVYRLAVEAQVTAALKTLGYVVEDRVDQANPKLADKSVDTLTYGCAVANQDIRTVATALNNAGIPIRRIAPAEKNKDPNLIQLVSSRFTADTMRRKSISDISNWARPDKPCH